jgi:hypothetical protein
MKLDVAKKIKAFCAEEVILFAHVLWCRERFDIALAADGVDITTACYDGDGADPMPSQNGF